jgi:hypothetical protein
MENFGTMYIRLLEPRSTRGIDTSFTLPLAPRLVLLVEGGMSFFVSSVISYVVCVR